jgi:hypothetical protein
MTCRIHACALGDVHKAMADYTNNRLDWTVLEIRDTVDGYRNLNEATVQKLMASEDLDVLTPSLQRSILGQVITTPDALTAQVNRAAILVTNQWAITIYGDSLVHCMEALLKYRNAVATQLKTTVTGVLKTPFVENTGTLSDAATRRDKKKRIRNFANQVLWAVVPALVGAVLGVVGTALYGRLIE